MDAFRAAVWRAVVLLAACLAASAAIAQQPPPAADFFDRQAMYASLSPDGRQLAIVVRPRGQTGRLVVMDTDTLKAKPIASFSDGDVMWTRWINDRRLVIAITGGIHNSTTVRAINSDGSEMSGELGGGRFAFALPLENSDDFFMASNKYDLRDNYGRTDLHRVNSRTGRGPTLTPPGDTTSWLVDENGVPAVVTTRERANRSTARYRDPVKNEWRTLFEFDAFGSAAIYPVALGPGPNPALYVRAYNGADRSSLYAYDLATNKMDPQPLLSITGYDFDGSMVVHAGKVVGVEYRGDARARAWFDPAFKAIQEKLDKQLPGTVNRIVTSVRNQTTKLLVFASSDREAGTFYLYDSADGKLVQLGKTRQWIDPARMAKVDVVKYTARDGLEIPARVTLPNGAGKDQPLIVLVHTDPFARGGSWSWDNRAQFLASRGYAVIEPEYRGSRGFGLKHFKSGWKQWGLAMQDDLADAAAWAVKQGYADPRRVCIAGRGYGGYAALMGLARNPETFRCGVALQAITDLPEYASNWMHFTEEFREVGFPLLVGDVETEAARLKSTSPLYRAADIRGPVFMAHWSRDREVPFAHASKMMDALKANGTPVEFVEYNNDWTPNRDAGEEVDVWTRIEKFLAKNLAAP